MLRVYLKKVYIVSVENTRNSAQLREAKGTALQTDLAPLCLSNSADERYTQLRRAERGQGHSLQTDLAPLSLSNSAQISEIWNKVSTYRLNTEHFLLLVLHRMGHFKWKLSYMCVCA